MDFLDRMNAAMAYIEDRLAGEVDFRELAHRIGCTEYHLSRMFPFITGQGLGLYIRRRRMTQAAMEVLRPEADLLTIAVKFGYSSVDAFSRSFREVHGVSPSEIRNGQGSVRSYPPLSFSMTVKGAQAMVYRTLDQPPFRIVGISKTVPLVFSGPNPEIDAMWKSVTPEQIGRWKTLSDLEPRGIISASTHFSDQRMAGHGTLDHYIGAATTQRSPLDTSSLEVQAGRWAIFEAVGNFPHNLQSLWGRIYAEWFPSSDFVLREGPEMLWNEGPDTTKLDFRSEIWIPIQPR